MFDYFVWTSSHPGSNPGGIKGFFPSKREIEQSKKIKDKLGKTALNELQLRSSVINFAWLGIGLNWSSCECCNQCDQIGLLRKDFVTKFLSKLAQRFENFYGYFEKCLSLSFCSFFWKKIGDFCHQHLVTLDLQ